MDGVDAVLPGDGDDAVDVEIRADRLAGLADLIGFVGLEAVQGVAIFVRVDGDRADAQLVGRAKHADGDFAAIGDQQLANSLCHKSGRPSQRLEHASSGLGTKCNSAGVPSTRGRNYPAGVHGRAATVAAVSQPASYIIKHNLPACTAICAAACATRPY